MSQLTEKTAGTGSNADRSEAESEKSVTTEKIKVPTVAKPKMRLDENGKIVIDKMSLYQTFQNERKVFSQFLKVLRVAWLANSYFGFIEF